MKLIPIFIILLFFTGVLLIVYVTWATLSRRSSSTGSLFGDSGDTVEGGQEDECGGCDIPFNLRKLSPPQSKLGGGEVPLPEGIKSVDEVALYGEDFLKAAERMKMKVYGNLRRHVINGAKVIGHLNHYGVDFTKLRPRIINPSIERIKCQIKSLKFDILSQRTSSVFRGKTFPDEPLFSDFFVSGGKYAIENQLMKKELVLSDDDTNSNEPLFRSCAVVPNSAALDGSQHGVDIDSHDFVLRFNNAPTKGYEDDVGTITSMRIVNSQVVTKSVFQFPSSAYHSIMEQQNINNNSRTNLNLSNADKDNLDALWSASKKYLIWDPCNYSSTVEQWYQKPDYPLFEKYFELTSNTKKYGQDKYYILNCRVIWKLWEILHEFTFEKIYGNPPTSGFIGIVLALQKCEKVNVYEFIPSSRESVRCHYYGPKNDSNPSCTYGSWHPLSAEKLFFLSLTDGTDKQIFMDGVLPISGVSKLKC